MLHSLSIVNNKNLRLVPSDDKTIILTTVAPVVACNLLMSD